MKTPASVRFTLFSLIVFILIEPSLLSGGNARAYRITCDQDLSLHSSSGFSYLKPLLREYSNYRFDSGTLPREISYQVIPVQKNHISVREVVGESFIGTHLFLSGVVDAERITSSNIIADYRDSIVQVVIREDDSYIGYLTELFNTPFIWMPKRFSSMHQTDSCLGSDCISFVIYGKRRQNVEIQYMPLSHIGRYTDDLFNQAFKQTNGIYISEDARPVTTANIRREDLIYFGPHIAVFYRDAGVIGTLDKDDLIIHSIGCGAHISTIENSLYYRFPVRILRWK